MPRPTKSERTSSHGRYGKHGRKIKPNPKFTETILPKENKVIPSIPNRLRPTSNGNIISHRLIQIRYLATDGPLSYRALAITGGLGVIVTSILSMVRNVQTFSFNKVVVSIYLLLFGFLICLLELPLLIANEKLNQTRVYIYELFRFLRFLWGRGILYLFVGILQMFQMHSIDLGSGGFMIFIGILSTIVGKSTARRLNDLSTVIFDDVLMRNQFDEFDLEDNGYLTETQFSSFIRGIGLELGKNEYKNVFQEIDCNDNDEICYAQFKTWWDNTLDEGIEDYLILL